MLPMPANQQIQDLENEENEIKIILNKGKNLPSEVEKSSKTTSIENSILDKIK